LSSELFLEGLDLLAQEFALLVQERAAPGPLFVLDFTINIDELALADPQVALQLTLLTQWGSIAGRRAWRAPGSGSAFVFGLPGIRITPAVAVASAGFIAFDEPGRTAGNGRHRHPDDGDGDDGEYPD
jgi:hypothetical protein